MAAAPRSVVLLTASALVVAGLTLACGSTGGPADGAAACGANEPPITQGPRVGAVTESAAKVWVRACRPVDVSVQYKPASADWSAAQESASVATDRTADNTAAVPLDGLQPGAAYQYRVLADGAQPAEPLEGSFKTMPRPGAGTVSFLVGADLHPGDEPLTIFDRLAQQPADFALLFGDLIDIEPLRVEAAPAAAATPATPAASPTRPSPQSKRDYERLYQKTWGDAHFRSFMSAIPTFMMWDDHDILNDWDGGTAPPYPFARAAFDEYVRLGNPQPVSRGELYYTFRAGDAGFFVLDTRTYRSPEENADVAAKTMLGARQKAELKRWLLGSRAKFKFIVSSVMWSNDAKHKEEAWINYRTERDEIFNVIRDQDVTGVVLLSADEHWNAVARIAPWNLYEFAASPLGGVPFLQTFTADPELLFKLGRTHAFGHYTIDATGCPATATFRIIDAEGKLLHEVSLSELDLNAAQVDPAAYCRSVAEGETDSDGDGCTDNQERGDDEKRGGRRDPENRWDFYDVTRDGVVDFADVRSVNAKLGTKLGDAAYDPLYDRSAPAAGADPWDLAPPDGVVDLNDFFLAIGQVGHSCAAAP